MRTAEAMLALLLAAPASDWKRIEPGVAIELPRDHGSHPEFRTEWWYVTGHLADEGGREFGFQFTVFRSGLDPDPAAPGDSPLRARHAFAAHFAIADVANDRLLFAERLRRGAPGLAGAATGRLDAFVENWSIAMNAGGSISIRARDLAAGTALDVALAPAKPAVLHGADGYSRKGYDPGNASAYASFTRLDASGALEIAGRSRRVTGVAWFDHEWGTTQLGAGVVGWDWMSLQLDDGRDLMLYALRRADGTSAPFSAGTLVERDGAARRLESGEFSIEPTARWTSPRTKAAYPAAWRVRVPSAAIDLEIRPRIADCEMSTEGSTGVTYWEGPVGVAGNARGRGYVELTGYAGSLGGVF